MDREVIVLASERGCALLASAALFISHDIVPTGNLIRLVSSRESGDVRCPYARAAAWIAGADRWTEAMWRNLEQQVGAPEPLPDEQATEPGGASASIAGVLRRRPEQRSRRVFRSSYMS